MRDQEKTTLNEKDKELFLKALMEFRNTGTNYIVCDVCKEAIRFTDVGSATKHECGCGKFNGTLRGL